MSGKIALKTQADGTSERPKDRTAWDRLAAALFSSDALLGPLAVAVLIGLAIASLPRAPEHLDADASWCAVLDYAHQHGFQFGTDVVFPYGPLGFLVVPFLSWHMPGRQIAAAVGLGFLAALGVCLIAWRLRWTWRWLLLGMFVFICSNVQPRTDLLLDTALFSWAVLCWVESGRRLSRFALVLGALAGWLGLVKISLLVLGSLSLGTLVIDLCLRGHVRLAVMMLLIYLATLATGWVGQGQALNHVIPFLVHGLAVSKAYASTMGVERLPGSTTAAVALVLLVTGAATLRALGAFEREQATNRARRCVLLAWLVTFVALVWKHGYLRADRYHVVIFLGFAPVLVLTLEALPVAAARLRNWARGLAVAACLPALWSLQASFFPSHTESLVQPAVGSSYNLRCLFHVSGYQQQMREQIQAEQRRAEMPKARALVGRARIDVFGNAQWPVLANDFNYYPRPAFQSYVAATTPLMRLNEASYRSPAAPEYVFFRLDPIDHRFPPLEDALVLRNLLAKYAYVATEGPYLLLRSNTSGSPRLALLRQGAIRPREPILLGSDADTDLWLEIDAEPSWRGRARGILYQAPLVRLGVEREPGARPLKFRAPPPMLAAGFLASPLLLDNEDVLRFYTAGTIGRPQAYTIELLPGQESLWQSSFTYRLYRIEGLRAAPKTGNSVLGSVPRAEPLAGELGNGHS